MRILVYGAGVVGSQYAALLHRAGHDVSLLARGQRLADLREHGIVLQAVDTGSALWPGPRWWIASRRRMRMIW